MPVLTIWSAIWGSSRLYHRLAVGFIRNGENMRHIFTAIFTLLLFCPFSGFAETQKGDVFEQKTPDDVTPKGWDVSPKEWVERGYQYYLNNELGKAIDAYTMAIDFGGHDYAPAYNNRGLAYNDRGLYDRAIEDFNKAIALDPKDALAYGIRGLAYYMKRQYDRAIEDYNKAIALDSNIPMPYLTRGLAYNIKGNMGMAISDFRKACDLGFQQGCESLQKALKER